LNLQNEGLTIQSDLFDDLSKELRWVLQFNGYVLDTNRNVFDLFSFEDSFFESISTPNQKTAYEFIQNILVNSYGEQVLLHETPSNAIIPVFYRAKLVNNVILLNGTTKSKVSKNSQEQYQIKEFVTNHLDVAVLFLNKDKEIIYCNEKFCRMLTLHSSPENLTTELLILLSSETQPFVQKLFKLTNQALEKKESIESYYYEEEVLYQIQVHFFESTHNICLVIHDRSYQHRFENLLMYKRQMETVSQISAGVAHELRNPLSVIKGFLQLGSITNDWDKYYSTVMSELNRMNDIIEDFLSISRKKLTREPYYPHKVLESLVYLIRSECILHNITFKYEKEETNKKILLNEAMIKQVLLNLLRNAIDAYELQKDLRTFSLKSYVLDSNYIIKVKDTGPGMSPEVLEQLGKPFFTTKEKGNGIGIPLCKKIIEDHGGTLIIESRVGEGTCITFSLPLINN
jgi:signal transduction histidine kinase